MISALWQARCASNAKRPDRSTGGTLADPRCVLHRCSSEDVKGIQAFLRQKQIDDAVQDYLNRGDDPMPPQTLGHHKHDPRADNCILYGVDNPTPAKAQSPQGNSTGSGCGPCSPPWVLPPPVRHLKEIGEMPRAPSPTSSWKLASHQEDRGKRTELCSSPCHQDGQRSQKS